MGTCTDIIQSAYRRAGVLAARVPMSADQAQTGLEQLQGMYEEMSNGLFGQVRDYVLTSGPYTACENQRIYKQDPTSVITLPTIITPQFLTTDCSCDTSDYGFSYSGKARPPIDGALVIIVDPTVNVPIIWLYNALMAKWQSVVTLALSDIAPLSYQFEEPLKNMLAVVLADERGMPISPLIARRAATGKLAIGSRRQHASQTTRSLYF